MELLINKNESEGDIQLSIMDNYGRSFCMLNYYEKEKHSMFFSNFCVNKDNRNKGIGYFFIKQVMDYAESLGCEYFYLEVLVSNDWVYKWYKRLGFIDYKSDGERISMFKKLNN